MLRRDDDDAGCWQREMTQMSGGVLKDWAPFFFETQIILLGYGRHIGTMGVRSASVSRLNICKQIEHLQAD